MSTLLIKNAAIEIGFDVDERQVVRTLTELRDILIENGKITQIANNIHQKDHMDVLDAEGKLVLPALREMHIHIDKTYFGGSWKAPKPNEKGIFTRIEEELTILPNQLEFAEERARKIVDHLISHGHTHIRTHCNIDPGIELKHLEITLKVLEDYKDKLTYEIVAFPQHGLLRSNVEPLMREAMRMGANLVGGVDPATVDRDIDRSLETMFDIAVEAGKGIDIHIHEPDTLGIFTFEKMVDFIKQAKLENQVTISHAFALGHIKEDKEMLKDITQMLAEVGIDVTSTIPIGSPTIPVKELDQFGVPVSVGHDSLIDHWSPFGTGNTIEKLSVLAERFRFIDEISLSQLWKYGSGGINSLNVEGEQQWPNVGDKGSMVLVNAKCTAETIARRKDITHTIFNGKIINQ